MAAPAPTTGVAATATVTAAAAAADGAATTAAPVAAGDGGGSGGDEPLTPSPAHPISGVPPPQPRLRGGLGRVRAGAEQQPNRPREQPRRRGRRQRQRPRQRQRGWQWRRRQRRWTEAMPRAATSVARHASPRHAAYSRLRGTPPSCAVVLKGRFRNRPEIGFAGCGRECGPPLTVRAPQQSLFLFAYLLRSVDVHPAYDDYVKHHVQSYKSMPSSRACVARPSPSWAPLNRCQQHPVIYCRIHKKAADEASERACSEEGAGPSTSVDWLMPDGTVHTER